MKPIKLIVLLLGFFFSISETVGQSNASISVLTQNSGLVNIGGSVFIQVTVNSTGPTTGISTYRARAQISVPSAIVSVAPNAQQTGLPVGWTIVSNTGSAITVCNATDAIPVGASRTILIAVQGNTVGGPSTITGTLSFGNGSAATGCTTLTGSLAGDNPGDNTSTSSIQVLPVTPCNLAITASAGNILCNGGTTTLTATASAANGTVEYSITGAAPFQASNIFTVTAGTYTITAREVSNTTCIATSAAVTITQPTLLTATATSTAVTTIGGSNGTATVVPSGGTAPYTYSWNTIPAQTGITATGLAAGSYIVTVTDANNCTTTAIIAVGSPGCSLSVSTSAGTILCNGGTTTLTVTAIGGTGALQYSLNGGVFQPGNVFTVNAGTYTVTVRDMNLCTVITTDVTINQPSVITAAASAGIILCNGSTTVLTVAASGGTGTFQYSLNGGTYQQSNTFTVGAGTYTVTVRDENFCTVTTTAVTINQPSVITAVASAGTILCNGGTTTLTVAASGGTGVQQYSLNGGAFQPANNFTVAAGTYIVTVRDQNLCTITTTPVIVAQPTILSVTATSTAVTTVGGSDGTATATPSGGTAPYNYSWNTIPVQTAITATGLTADSYTVTITDANGCTALATTSIGSPSCTLSASASAGTISCNNGTTILTVIANGGNGPLQYSLNGGTFQTDNTFSVAAGTHTVTVREINNPTCTATTPAVTIGQPNVITVSASAGVILCNGGATTLTVTASGGTGILQYSLNGGTFQTTNNFTVTAGTYTVTVRDQNLCTATTSVLTINQPSAITATASAGSILCNGGTTTLTVTANGGAGVLQYSLNGGGFQTGNTFTVAAGIYIVTVRDASLCTATTIPVTVVEPAVIAASVSAGTITCFGGTAQLTVTASGGTGTLEYSLNGGAFQLSNIFIVVAGIQTITVRDENQCIITILKTITQPSAFTASASAGTIQCNGGTTILTVTASGGTGTLEYSLNGNAFQPNNTFTISDGTYTVIVRDENLCTATTSAITITQPALILATASAGTIACNGGTTILTTTASGGTGTLQYSLNGGVFQPNNTFTVSEGAYSVTVQDANLCTATTTSVIVTQPTAITASASAGTIVCFGGTTTLTVAASGGTGILQYSLNGSAFQSNNTFTVTAGTYTATVRDENLCSKTTAALVVTQPTSFTASASVGIIACSGGSVNLSVAVTGGTAPFQYGLNGGAFQQSNTFIVNAGTYTVTVRDANLCTATAVAVTVTQPNILIASAIAKRITECGGSTVVTVAASGGTAPYTGVGNFTRGPGTWSFPVTDAGGCTSTKEITIEAPGCMNLIVYPNPTPSNSINIYHSVAESGSVMKVFGINGALVLTKQVQANAFQTTLDITRLASGIYMIVYWSGIEKRVAKFEKL